ncbi:hypothetical protein [Oceanicoccus sagamiensis]|uniref:Uncharacterized protein n=1 Tax=Oceanicoccus sagamiensis TaxID=716816 RepID=A0A1X9NE05_9GAMM|nr:hypothetical protein [Oceanicoccus sagamiensis]ARN75381.1 hypothetical protein BST96_15430 [Oceanicoccus sagamiensis]
MDQPLFDIIFTGQLVEGTDTDSAKSNLATLFKTSADNVEKIFNGKPQALKRGVDKAQALKYKAALHKAGLLVAFKAHQAASEAPAAKPQAPEQSQYQPPQQAPQHPSQQAETAAAPAQKAEDDWSLAPAGSDLLKDNERQQSPEVAVDTSNIKMVSAFMEPEPEVKAVPPAPDTRHLSAAAVGEDLLTEKPEAPPPLPLNLDNISLAPAGTELEQLQDQRPPLDPDISGISIAEAGADLLEGQVKPPPPPAPNTDHMSVAGDK